MNVKKPTSYEGNENYIFISYAHSDSEIVYSILNRLEEEGYRFWYDDGIAPGSEWPEDIAQHLSRAALFIAFITQNSVNSSNCRREINYALSKEKPFLSVILEQTEMSLGLEMQLSSQQSVIRYNYRTEEEFMKKLLSTAALESCRKPKPAVTAFEAAPAEEKTASGITISPAETEGRSGDPVAVEVTTAAHGSIPASSAGGTETDVDIENTGKTGGRFGRKKKADTAAELTATASDDTSGKKKRRLPVIIGVAALALILCIVWFATGSIKTSWGEKIGKKETYLHISGKTITQDDLDRIFALKHLRTLSLEECDLSGCDTSGLSLASDDLDYIYIDYCSGINDYGFLNGPALTSLQVLGDTGFTDISSINTDELFVLNISGTGVSDISVLENAPRLNGLDISNTPVSDISAISSVATLEEFNCSNTNVTSLAPIEYLEDLRVLNFSGCKVKLPSGLSTLSLTELSCSDCGLSDLKVFENQTKLESINISKNPGIKDMGWLSKYNHDTITSLNVSQTGLERDDLDFIGECKQIETLNIRGLHDLGDVGFCKTVYGLKTICAEGCGLKDISGLSNCTSLENVMISFNEIEKIGPLAKLQPTSSTVLDLSHNKISDLSGLPAGEYHTILTTGNDKKVASTIPANVNGYQLTADWSKEIKNSNISKERNFSYVYLVGVPAEEQLKTKESFKSSIIMLTDKELYDLLKKNDMEFSFHYKLDYSYPASLLK